MKKDQFSPLTVDETGKLHGGFSTMNIKPVEWNGNSNVNCLGNGEGDTNTNCTGTCKACGFVEPPINPKPNPTDVPVEQ